MTIKNNINNFLTPEIFAKESAVALRHELVMKNIVSTSLSKEFGAIGDTINVKDFSTFKIRKDNHEFGKGYNGEDEYNSVNRINESSIPVRIEYQDGIDTSYSFKEVQLDMTLSDFHNNVIKPQAATLSEYVDRTILGKIQEMDSNVATVSSYINNPDIYNDKLKTIPKINATRGVATKIGFPSTGCSFLFSSDANTILSNELVGLNTTQYPAKILERGYIATISGGTHIYENPSILKDYKVYRAKETSVNLANNDATKYIINILKAKKDVTVTSVRDKIILTVNLEKVKKPTAAKADSATEDELKAINTYEEQEARIDNYVDHKVYLEGLTFGHLFYEKKDTGVALQGKLKKSGSSYFLKFDLTRVKRRVQNRIKDKGSQKEWGVKNEKYEVYFEGEHLVNVDQINKIIGNKSNLEIYPISNPLIVSRNVGYYIHKEAVKLVIAPPAPLDEKAKLMNTGDFTFRITQWTEYASDTVNVKMDIMWGVKVIRPELIIKIIM